jgi:hypothetical protein
MARGESIGPVGQFHDPKTHNYMNYNHADSKRVTTEDAAQFKHFMTTDKPDFLRTKPAHPMYYDKGFNYTKDRDFWFKFLLAMYFGSYAFYKYHIEVDRARRTARLGGYEGMPAHHFHNRGGVVILKDFTGFQKYYKNGDEMMEWYKLVYPEKFQTKS